MRKLLMCLFAVGVSLAAATPSSHAIPTTCLFRCCSIAHTSTTPCTNGTVSTTCGAWLQTHGCP
jgi:hypothetical protein